MKFFNIVPNDWKIMEHGGFSKLLKPFMICTVLQKYVNEGYCVLVSVNDLKRLTFLFILIWWAHIKCWLLLIIICAYRKHKSLTWASSFEKCCLEQYQRHQLLTIEHILHAMRPTDETILGPVQLTFQYKALTKIKLLHLPFTFIFKSRLSSCLLEFKPLRAFVISKTLLKQQGSFRK